MKKVNLPINTNHAKRGYDYMKNYGVTKLYLKVRERMDRNAFEKNYQQWMFSQRPSEVEMEIQKNYSFKERPKISVIVPVYCTPEDYLREMVESVLSQTYENLELCLADGSEKDDRAEQILREYEKKDGRVRYQRLDKNLGISGNTNAALEMASGDYIALLDHDDFLEAHALFEMVKWLEEHPNTDVLYTDEDKVSFAADTYFQPHFKPDFNLDLLRSNNYICHFLLVKTQLAREVGAYREEFDGAQDYDFILRCCEMAERIEHLPKVLYHWRCHMDSTAANPESKAYAYEAGRRAVEMHLQRMKILAKVEPMDNPGFYRVNYALTSEPKVSIILFDLGSVGEIKKFLKVIESKANYKNFELLLLIDTQEKTKLVLNFIKEHRQIPIKVVYCTSACNKFVTFSKLAEKLDSEYLLFLEGRIEKISKCFLEIFLGSAQRSEVGAVGGRVYNAEHRLQHGAKILNLNGLVGDAFAGLPVGYTGYFHKAVLQQNFHAVSARAMMVKREHFLEVGGFSEDVEDRMKDVDFCLKLEGLGLKNVYEPGVMVLEQKSSFGKKKKIKAAAFEKKWQQQLGQPDKYYNENLSLEDSNYRIRHF